MLILLDDIKLNEKDTFFGYINQSFKDKEILDLDTLYDYLSEVKQEIEFLVTDIQDVTEAGKSFAGKVMETLLDVRNQNSLIKVTTM